MRTAKWRAALCALALLGMAGSAFGAEASAPEASEGVFAMVRWSPYVAGALLGVLGWGTLLFSGHTLGASGAYTQTSGLIERGVRGPEALERPYFQKLVPRVDWSVMLLAGVVLGALFSAALSGTFGGELVPPLWRERFGPGIGQRLVAAFAGGMLMGIGARWAGGCTSGHGISGNIQLMIASLLASACFFIGGVATAFWLY